MSYIKDSSANIDKKGAQTTFLTPTKTAPHLRTSITRPRNVFLETLSPIYQQSFIRPSTPKLTDICTSALLTTESHVGFEVGTKDDKVKNDINETDRDTVESSTVELLGSSQQKFEEHLKGGQFVNATDSGFEEHHTNNRTSEQIEAQILSKGDLAEFSDLLTYDTVPDCDSQAKDNIPYVRRRCNTSSFCSSYSGDDSVTAQSRCSMCDGCSSSTCNSLLSRSFSNEAQKDDIDRPSKTFAYLSGHATDLSLDKIEELFDAHLTFDQIDDGSTLPSDCYHEVKATDRDKQLDLKSASGKLSLSDTQFIFLLLRMILSRYRQLTDDIAAERKISSSQRKSIACLIQTVVLLSRKFQCSVSQWHRTQKDLKLVKLENQALKKQYKKILIGVSILVVINILNITVIRRKILSIVKFFGIVETAKKINRTRKMIGENWRNIPSLLTEFWRILIFRHNIKLKTS